jgi:hypothetical protein
VQIDNAGVGMGMFVFEETAFQLQAFGGCESEILSVACFGDEG